MARAGTQHAVPELAAVEVRGTTRQAFLLRGALAAVGSYGVGAMAPFVRRAVAQSGEQDVDVIQFALALERLEAAYYRRAATGVRGLGGDTLALTKTLRDNEEEHVDVLEGLVQQLGGVPPRKPEFEFGDALSSEENFLRLAQTLEETGVSAYNGAAPGISSTDVLETAGRIVQVEARHAALVRFIRDEDIAPSAFDEALDRPTVEKRVDRFIR